MLQSNCQEEFHCHLQGKIDRLREDNTKLFQKKLSQELEQAKLEMKLKRQNQFAKVLRDAL